MWRITLSSHDRVARIATHSGPVDVTFSDGEWAGIHDPFADRLVLTGARFGTDVEFLAPCEPRVILGMAHNGPGGRELPPQAFSKSARTVVGPGAPILIDSTAGMVNAEGELAIVMRRLSRHLAADEVAGAILGFTVANDVTAFDQVSRDSMMTQAKNGDGFTPLGPWVQTGLDPRDVAIDVIVNGERRATGSTSGLAYSVVEQIVYLTSIMTLGPGDVVLTGAPGTITPIIPGDEVSIALDGVGVLTNPVASLGIGPAMTLMKLRPAAECEFDAVSLGEVMLRFDPGEGRIRTARSFNVWEGGGEYNVSRALSRTFGLRTSVATSLVDNELGRLAESLILSGGVDTSLIVWREFDGIGRAARNALNFTERGFGIRGAIGVSDRGHSAASLLTPAEIDWDHLFGSAGCAGYTSGASSPGCRTRRLRPRWQQHPSPKPTAQPCRSI